MSNLPNEVISLIMSFISPSYPYIYELKAYLHFYTSYGEPNWEPKVWGASYDHYCFKNGLARECRGLWLDYLHNNAEVHSGWGRRSRAGRLLSSRPFTKHQLQKCGWLEVFARRHTYGDELHFWTKQFLNAY